MTRATTTGPRSTRATVEPGPLTAADVALIACQYLPAWRVLDIAVTGGDRALLARVPGELLSTRAGVAGAGVRWDTLTDGIHASIDAAPAGRTTTRGARDTDKANRSQPRAGVITWAALFAYVLDRVTPDRLDALRAALTAARLHDARAVARPGTYPDADTWWTQYGQHHTRTGRDLDQAATTAAAAILTAPLDTQLDLLDALNAEVSNAGHGVTS